MAKLAKESPLQNSAESPPPPDIDRSIAAEAPPPGLSSADELAAARTIAQVAARIGLSYRAVHRAVERGDLRATRLGSGRGVWRITERALSDYLDERTTTRPRPPTTGSESDS